MITIYATIATTSTTPPRRSFTHRAVRCLSPASRPNGASPPRRRMPTWPRSPRAPAQAPRPPPRWPRPPRSPPGTSARPPPPPPHPPSPWPRSPPGRTTTTPGASVRLRAGGGASDGRTRTPSEGTASAPGRPAHGATSPAASRRRGVVVHRRSAGGGEKRERTAPACKKEVRRPSELS
ncbi:unnamed protein product, partial [Musa acuminata var. zebrina]